MYRIIFMFALICQSLTLFAYDVIGIGAPCVDILVRVTDEELCELSLKKGDSTLVDLNTFENILSAIPEENRSIQTGGSAANTIKGLASLNTSTAFFGRIGSGKMSDYFYQMTERLNITPCFVVSEKPIQQIICLITPDGQRTFCVYLGAMEDFQANDIVSDDFDGAKFVHIEGYALHNVGVVEKVVACAKAANVRVSMDLGAMRVVNCFKNHLLEILENDVDIVFGNQDEVEALLGLQPEDGCKALSKLCGFAVIMVGKEGCWVGVDGNVVACPGYEVSVVDTTGAGDLFAAGFLHGLMENQPLSICGLWGNMAGSQVIQQMGAELNNQKWVELKEKMAATRL